MGFSMLQDNKRQNLKFTVKRIYIFFEIEMLDKTPVLHTFPGNHHLVFFFFFTFTLKQ